MQALTGRTAGTADGWEIPRGYGWAVALDERSTGAAASLEPMPPSGVGPGQRRVGAALLWLVVPVAVVMLAAGLEYGGGRPGADLPGLGTPGPAVAWGLPVTRVLWDLAAIASVGAAVLAVLLPLRHGALAPDARRAMQAGAAAAAAWTALSFALALLTLADVDPGAVATPGATWANLQAFAPARDAALSGAVAAAATVALALGHTRDAPVTRLVVLLLVPLPVLFSGHSATAGDHLLAVSSLVVHVLSACLWVGGLAGLVAYALVGGRALAVAVARFSRLALVCYLAVGISGVGNAATRLTSVSDLASTGYGQLVLAKAALFVVLGATADRLRRGVVPVLTTGPAAGRLTGAARRAFTRFAAVEVLVMGATVGLAVALSRTPTPPSPEPTSVVESELGFVMPPPPTLSRLLFDVWPDWVFIALATVALGTYLAGVRRLRRRGDRWPVSRTVAWVVGWLLALVTTCSGLGRYGSLMFSVHMVQHMLLAMVVPIPLVLGAPVTLALRALRRGTNGRRGFREWLLAALHAPWMKVVAHPVFGFTLFVLSFYGLYFSPLFGSLMSGHLGHVAMNVHFLAVGYLLFWTVCGLDHSPVPLPHLGRLVIMFAAAPFHAFFAIALTVSTSVIAESWYAGLARPWDTDLLADQRLGGDLTWGFGEVPILLVSLALIVQWSRSDDRAARRHDRQADRDGDAELAAYNAYLASLQHPDRDDTERRIR